MTQIKIFTDISSLIQRNLKNLTPPLAFHWKGFDCVSIWKGENNPFSRFSLVGNPMAAKLFILPMRLPYYLWNWGSNMHEEICFAKLARELEKQVIVWHKGNLIPVIPFENAIVYLPGIIRSKMRINHRACLVFMDDPASVYGNGQPCLREKRDRPSVGFCGYSTASIIKLGWSIIRAIHLSFLSRIGRYDLEGIPIVPATLFRAKALRILSNRRAVDTNFIAIDRHTATRPRGSPGALTDVTRKFFSNIHGTDYTLCIRGYGNWSYMFYETLACGRIPVFVDTD